MIVSFELFLWCFWLVGLSFSHCLIFDLFLFWIAAPGRWRRGEIHGDLAHVARRGTR